MMSKRCITVFASLAACAPAPLVGEEDSSSTAPVLGDPDAPGEACTDAFDPNAIHILLNRAGSFGDIHYLADVRNPSRECAFKFTFPNDDEELGSTFGVRPDDGQMLVTHGLTAGASSYIDRHSLRAAFSDPLALVDGLWQQAGNDNDDVLLAFGKDGCWDADRKNSPILMAYVPTGELGYWCAGEGFYGFDDTLVVAVDSADPPALFLADGRVLMLAEVGFGHDRIVRATIDSDPVITPLDYPEDLRITDIPAARHIDGVPTLIVSAYDAQRSLYRVDGDVLELGYALPEPFPDSDYMIEQYALDDQGVIVLGARYEGGATDAPKTFVSRLDPSGAELLYIAAADRSPWALMDLPDSSGEVRIVRLVAPL